MRIWYLCAAFSTCIALASGSSFREIEQGGQSSLGGDASSAQTIKLALEKARLIPDVLNDFDVTFDIKPYYPKSGEKVALGNRLKPKAVKSVPDLYMNSIPATGIPDSNATYSLVLSDPDALSRKNPIKAQMCHWILTNITIPSPEHNLGSSFDLRSILASGGDGLLELVPYFPPAPPKKTAYHRYVFVLLVSKPGSRWSIPSKPKDRPHWGYGRVGAGVREWALENDLIVVGANFFYARNKKQ